MVSDLINKLKSKGNPSELSVSTRVIMWVLVASFFFMLFIFPIKNYDIFWHLANGRVMVEEGRIVNEELFSHTVPGTPFENKEWLSQVAFYLIYAVGGANGLILFKSFLLLGVVALLYRTSRFTCSSESVVLLVILFALLVCLPRFLVRPHIYSFLFLVYVQFILHGSRSGKINSRWLFSFVLILPLWDMFQGALWGVIFLGAYAAGEVVYIIYCKARGHEHGLPEGYLRRLVQSGIVVFVVMMISPQGLRGYLEYFAIMDKSSAMFSFVSEFMPTALDTQPLYWGMLVLVVLSLIVFARKIPLPYIFSLIPFIWMSLRFVRATGIFALLSVTVLSMAFSELIRLASGRRWTRYVLHSGFTLLLILLLSWSWDAKFGYDESIYRFGLGLNESYFPVAEARFIKDVDIKGNMFNAEFYGGYLAFEFFPKHRIYMYNLPSVFESVFFKTQSREALDEYNINWALVTYTNGWDQLLFLPQQWHPVFWHGEHAVAVRVLPRNREFIERYGLRYILPGAKAADIRVRLRDDPQSAPHVLKEAGMLLKYGSNRGIAEIAGELAVRLNLNSASGRKLCSEALVYNPDNDALNRCLKYYEQR